jgi:hypothetical protein
MAESRDKSRKILWNTGLAQSIQFQFVGNSTLEQFLADVAQGLVAGLCVVGGHQGTGIGALQNGLSQRGIHCDKFGQGDAAAISGSIGRFAADEALRDDAVNAAGELVGFDSHLEQSRQRSSGCAGMEGGDEPMAGQGGLHGEGSGGGVAHLAEHQHLRVLAENAAQGFFVGELSEGGDFDLRDAGDVALDGVFQGDDAEAGILAGDLAEQGVDRRGFSRAGWTGEDEHPAIGGGECEQTLKNRRGQ